MLIFTLPNGTAFFQSCSYKGYRSLGSANQLQVAEADRITTLLSDELFIFGDDKHLYCTPSFAFISHQINIFVNKYWCRLTIY